MMTIDRMNRLMGRWLKIGVISAIVLLMAGCASGTVYDFDDGAEPENILFEGGYHGVSEEGVLRLIVTESGRNQRATMQLAPVDDVTQVEALMRVNDGRMQMIVAADEELCQGYGLMIDPTLNAYSLFKLVDCERETLDYSTRLEVEPDTWHRVQLGFDGDRVVANIDAARIFDVEDTDYRSGAVVLRVLNESDPAAVLDVDEIQYR